jgi:hypothetical protein
MLATIIDMIRENSQCECLGCNFMLPDFIRQKPEIAKAGPTRATGFQLAVIAYSGFAVSYTLSDSTLEIRHIAQYLMSMLRLLINDPDKA